MSDLFAPLREPEAVSSLPPEEVRRRGDRLRRRRAGLAVAGATCAAAVAVTATALLTGAPTSPDSAPGPASSPAVDGVIPAELDLAEALPRESTRTDAGAPELVICGEPFALDDGATASQQVDHATIGDFRVRGLSVFPDAGAARAVVTDLVAAFEGCPSYTDKQGREWTTDVRPTDHGDQGWAVTRVVDAPGRTVPEVLQVVRMGANVLVVHEREIHGVPVEALIRGTGDQVEWLLHRELCLLTEEGCAWRSDPDVLRPDGWGPLRLGMSREEVEAAVSAEFGEAGECTAFRLGSVEGLIAESGELVALEVPDAVTADGIGVGSDRDEVVDAYWFAGGDGGVLRVRASPTSDYELTFEGDRVSRLRLVSVETTCL